ncbi:MAG: carbon storage regulator CsrA [Firmicutes bacterium]|nr:carbon storage regulator CsrA [Bacillota bacterium]
MLVLTRKKQESIHIGNDIEITILEIDGERVKLGIKAPKACTILRGELVVETQCINRESTNVSMNNLQEILKGLKK